MKDLKYSVDVESSIRPVAISGSSAVNGVAVDKLGFDDALAVVSLGAESGSPDSFSFAAKVQESANGSTGWADVANATATLTEENTVAKFKVPDMLNRLRYLRVVITPTFVNGSSPAVVSTGALLLGAKNVEPV